MRDKLVVKLPSRSRGSLFRQIDRKDFCERQACREASIKVSGVLIQTNRQEDKPQTERRE